jgi:hypothetical protein
VTTSAVSICSNALLDVGAQTIASFDEATDRATIVANRWESVRDATLRAHPWNCAVRRVILAPEVGTPAFDYAYAFVLPGDWLRTLQVGEYGEEIDYRTESGQILAHVTALRLRYIWKNTEPASWDAMLIEAMTKAMSAAIAYPITQSTSFAQTKRDEYVEFMKQTRSVDGQDDPPEQLGDTRLFNARFGPSRNW